MIESELLCINKCGMEQTHEAIGENCIGRTVWRCKGCNCRRTGPTIEKPPEGI